MNLLARVRGNESSVLCSGDGSGAPQCSLNTQIFPSDGFLHHRDGVKPGLSAHRVFASQS